MHYTKAGIFLTLIVGLITLVLVSLAYYRVQQTRVACTACALDTDLLPQLISKSDAASKDSSSLQQDSNDMNSRYLHRYRRRVYGPSHYYGYPGYGRYWRYNYPDDYQYNNYDDYEEEVSGNYAQDNYDDEKKNNCSMKAKTDGNNISGKYAKPEDYVYAPENVEHMKNGKVPVLFRVQSTGKTTQDKVTVLGNRPELKQGLVLKKKMMQGHEPMWEAVVFISPGPLSYNIQTYPIPIKPKTFTSVISPELIGRARSRQSASPDKQIVYQTL